MAMLYLMSHLTYVYNILSHTCIQYDHTSLLHIKPILMNNGAYLHVSYLPTCTLLLL